MSSMDVDNSGEPIRCLGAGRQCFFPHELGTSEDDNINPLVRYQMICYHYLHRIELDMEDFQCRGILNIPVRNYP